MFNFLFIHWDAAHADFDLGLLHLRWYSLLFVAGLWIAYGIAHVIFKREGIEIEKLQNLWIAIVIGAVVGARLGEVIFYDPETYIQDPMKIFRIWEGGLASHGATFVLMGVIAWYANKVMKLSFFGLGDKLVSGIAASAACVRFGNLMNAEIVGSPTNVPWAFIFTNYDDQPRHPVQLYEGLLYMVLCIALFYFYPKYRHKIGFTSGLFFVGMFGTRFLLEFFKENNSSLTENFPLTMGQLLSLPLAAIGFYLMCRKTAT